MRLIDAILNLLITTLIILHLLVAPYTKVEESFNLQATHDILRYGIPTKDISQNFRQYDHFSFPGAVPRSFVGALTLAALSKPLVYLIGDHPFYTQLIVRGVMGLLNALAILRYSNALTKAFGKDTGRWFVLLLACQFHVIYYASRTLPNMFAFFLTTLALRDFLPMEASNAPTRYNRGIFLMTLAAVIFRCEIAVLLFAQLFYMLVHPRMSLQVIVPTCLRSASISLLVTFVVDSYFWQRPIWPELTGFYYNVILGKSSDWGTSSFQYYYSNLLPKLLLNPFIFLILIPFGMRTMAIKHRLIELITPPLLYISIYSFQPHKELRFIIYVAVPFTAAASCSAAYIWNHSSKSFFYRFGSVFLVASIISSSLVSIAMLLISSLNYPGGHSISQLNHIIKQSSPKVSEVQAGHHQISVHMDVFSCMTGVTRFLEITGTGVIGKSLPIINGVPTLLKYDKTEDKTLLEQLEWWQQFDYALMEKPDSAMGNWSVIATVSGYAGIEMLRPGELNSSFLEYVEQALSASQAELENEEVTDDKDLVGMYDLNRTFIRTSFRKLVLRKKIRALNLVRLITRGPQKTLLWWVLVPRLEPKIRILKKHRESKSSNSVNESVGQK